MPLTKRQREIFDWLASYIADHGYAPSFEEIGRHFGFTSLATVHEHVSNLERKGYIRKSFNQSRSIELVGDGSVQGGIVLPLLGEVAAGQPIEAIADEESILVPPSLTRRTGKHYVLRVRGSSMIDEQIRDGDYIIVTSRETAADGEMVIALIGGESATMKKLYREEDGFLRLQPANASLAPMYLPADEVQVQGIVVGVMRRY